MTILPSTFPRWAPSRFPGGEEACILISSYGLMRSCAEWTLPRPGRDPVRPWRFLAQARARGAIYVHTTLLESFARRDLPRLTEPFTLVTGDRVEAAGPPALPGAVVRAISEHPLLRAWYAQNCPDPPAPRQCRMPIGLDYHSLSVGRAADWGPQQTPAAQEATLDLVRRRMPPLTDRAATAFCNAHLNVSHPARAGLAARLDPKAVTLQDSRLPRPQSWQANARHCATVSPRGGGMDCHRHYEAILLGAFPILQETPINAIFADLPHLVLRDWADLTPERLSEARREVLAQEFDFAPMLLAYWQDLFAEAAPAALRMPYQGFLETPLAGLRDLYRAARPVSPAAF